MQGSRVPVSRRCVKRLDLKAFPFFFEIFFFCCVTLVTALSRLKFTCGQISRPGCTRQYVTCSFPHHGRMIILLSLVMVVICASHESRPFQHHQRRMGDSKPFATAIYYLLLVQMIVVLLVDCYTVCTRVVGGVRFSAHLASYMSGLIVTTVGYTANAFVVICVFGNKNMRASPVNLLLFNLVSSTDCFFSVMLLSGDSGV